MLDIKRNCKHCNKEFTGRMRPVIAQFCSTYCQKEFWRVDNCVHDKARKSILYQSRKIELATRICTFCQNEFQPKRKDAKFCSQKCGGDHWRLNNKEYIAQDQQRLVCNFNNIRPLLAEDNLKKGDTYE